MRSLSPAMGHPYCAFIPRAKTGRADIMRLVELMASLK